MDGGSYGTDIRIITPMAFDADTLIAMLPDMKRFAYYLTANWDDAGDLVQTTCLKLLENGHRFDGRQPKAFAFHVMKNTWRDEISYRSHRNHPPVHDELDAAATDDPEAAFYAKEVIAAVDRVRSPFRETIIAHVLCASHAADDSRIVAAMTGIDRTVLVNQRLWRGRKQLAEIVA